MSLNTFKRTYLIAAVIVWVAILFASFTVLADSPHFGQMLPILGGGVVWFIIIVPGILRDVR